MPIADTFQKQFTSKHPQIRPGYMVRVHQNIKEGDKERIQVFEGLVIGTHGGSGVSSTFTVRKVSHGVGVERVFPLHSPKLAKIEVIKVVNVRRSKLYYLRDRKRKIRFKENETLLEKVSAQSAELEKAQQEKVKAETVTEVKKASKENKSEKKTSTKEKSEKLKKPAKTDEKNKK